MISSRRLLSVILWLTASHSAAVGLGLIILPDAAMHFFGLDPHGQQFFKTQGGVFHLVMAVAYGLAARSDIRRANLTEFAIIAKFMATIFLSGYYFLVEAVWTVLASAAGDCLLGVVILLSYLRWLRYERQVDHSSQYSARFRDA